MPTDDMPLSLGDLARAQLLVQCLLSCLRSLGLQSFHGLLADHGFRIGGVWKGDISMEYMLGPAERPCKARAGCQNALVQLRGLREGVPRVESRENDGFAVRA